MNMHKNARLTPRGRVLMVERIEQGVPMHQAAAAAGVSRQTAHRWLRRYRGGDHQLHDRSSAPHRHPHKLGMDRMARINMTPWLHWYNHHRPHSAIGALPPAHRVNNVLGYDS